MNPQLPHKTVIIAEAGVNHNGSLELALKMIEKAAQAGADSIKFQTFVTEELVRRDAPKATYQQKTGDPKESQYALLKNLELKFSDYESLRTACRQHKIEFLSTPFDLTSLRFLMHDLGLTRLKLGSSEVTNGPMLLTAAQNHADLILSTGMSDMAEIQLALSVLAFGFLRSEEKPSMGAFEAAYRSEEGQAWLKRKVTLLHATSQYPAPFEEIHLRALPVMRDAFGLSVGYSDHSTGMEIAIAAVALGASVIEKHVTLDRAMIGPDHQASLTFEDLAKMIPAIRHVELGLGNPSKLIVPCEQNTKKVAQRSLVANAPIKKGEKFTLKNLTAKRPADGISPMHYWEYLEKIADRDYQADEVITS